MQQVVGHSAARLITTPRVPARTTADAAETNEIECINCCGIRVRCFVVVLLLLL